MTDQRRPAHADDHYRDAAYYDHAYARYRNDLGAYARLAEAHGGPVLELGVGTGRVAMAIAERGVDVVGVEKMESMLERARAHLARRPRRVRDRVRLVHGDFRAVRLETVFPLVICPFNAFQHLYSREDIERGLETCRVHLAPGGRLVFDVLNPDIRSLARDPNRFYRCRPVTHPRDGRRYEYAEAFDFDLDRQVQTTIMRFRDPDGRDADFYQRLPQRQFFPEELRLILHYNGFDAVLTGGFEGEAVDEYADSIVVVATPRR